MTTVIAPDQPLAAAGAPDDGVILVADPTTGALVEAPVDATGSAGRVAARVAKAVGGAALSFIVVMVVWEAAILLLDETDRRWHTCDLWDVSPRGVTPRGRGVHTSPHASPSPPQPVHRPHARPDR